MLQFGVIIISFNIYIVNNHLKQMLFRNDGQISINLALTLNFKFMDTGNVTPPQKRRILLLRSLLFLTVGFFF